MNLTERLQQEVRRMSPAKTVATIAVSPFYGVGWFLAFLARVLWTVFSWLYSAIRLGIVDGWKG